MTPYGGAATIDFVRYAYDYPRPAVSADVALFAMGARDLEVLLVKRGRAPFKNAWALPGGFVEDNEPLVHAAARELAEETSVTGVPLAQLAAFGDPGRDPRGHTVTVVFYSFLVGGPIPPTAGDDAREAAWHSLRALPLPSWNGPPPDARGDAIRLAFDHADILDAARARLRERLADPARAAPFALVPPRFTLLELQRVHEAVLGRPLATRAFRSRLRRRGLVELVGGARSATRAPARGQLFRFNPGDD